MSNYYSQGSQDLINAIIQNFDYQIAFYDGVSEPFSLASFLLSEITALRTDATTSVEDGKIKISATIPTSGLSEDVNPTYCGIIIKDNIELLSIEPFFDTITPNSTLSVSHFYEVIVRV